MLIGRFFISILCTLATFTVIICLIDWKQSPIELSIIYFTKFYDDVINNLIDLILSWSYFDVQHTN